MEKWMEDIKTAIEVAKTSNGPSSDLLTINLTENSKWLHKHTVEYQMYTSVCSAVHNILSKNPTSWNPRFARLRLICEWSDIVCVLAPLPPSSPCLLSSSNNLLTFPECPEDSSVEAESEDDIAASHTSLERPAPHRGNTMVHVCWHRNTSVSMVDFSIAVEVPAKPQHSTSDTAPSHLLPHCFLSLCLSVCCILIHFEYFSVGTVSSCAALRHLNYFLLCLRTYFCYCELMKWNDLRLILFIIYYLFIIYSYKIRNG